MTRRGTMRTDRSAPASPEAPVTYSDRILVVDDDPFVRESLREILEHHGYEVLEAGDGKTALDILDQEPLELLLLDLQLPRVSGMEVLRQVADRQLDIRVVIISGEGSIPTAVRTMKLGAYDFIEKPLDAQKTLLTIQAAIEELSRRRSRVRSEEEVRSRYGMCGTSQAMQSVYETIDRAAATRAKVLVLGESGTGKEMVARAIHRLGPRSKERFVAINCAAIPEDLIESELFGHVEGAFTGARASHKGRFEQADTGTLFLDEVGDMSLMTQAKVLRAIEESQVQRVGGEHPIDVDVRIIAASNRALAADVQEGNFREDLYYRLSVIKLTIPPLHQRREDIRELAEYFLDLCSRENDVGAPPLTPAATTVLVEHDWPGNVRELRNVIERLVVFDDGGKIGPNDVRAAIETDESPDSPDRPTDLREARSRFEREFITASLLAHDWRIQDTAESLGINRSHLWKKMRQLNIEVSEEH